METKRKPFEVILSVFNTFVFICIFIYITQKLPFQKRSTFCLVLKQCVRTFNVRIKSISIIKTHEKGK